MKVETRRDILAQVDRRRVLRGLAEGYTSLAKLKKHIDPDSYLPTAYALRALTEMKIISISSYRPDGDREVTLHTPIFNKLVKERWEEDPGDNMTIFKSLRGRSRMHIMLHMYHKQSVMSFDELKAFISYKCTKVSENTAMGMIARSELLGVLEKCGNKYMMTQPAINLIEDFFDGGQ